MLVSQPPIPNPRIIEWAIQQSGYAHERVAKRLNVKPEQVMAWEQGTTPTVRQLKNLAAMVRRPLTLFYQSDLPQEKPLAAEYRRLPGVTPGAESPEFRRSVRDMLARREWAMDLMEELGHNLPEFSLAAHMIEDPREVGRRLRSHIGLTDQDQAGWRDKWQAWREWRTAIEELGVLVFMFPDVSLDESRGVALFRMPLPVVGVNTKEFAESRAYTALHEVVHLMLANGKEEAPASQETRNASQFEEVERFAEIAASYTLVSEEAFALAVGVAPPSDVPGMQQLAARFRMTPLAAATRLRESGWINWDEYNAWKGDWKAYVSSLPKAKGFARPEQKTLGRGGAMFAQLVFEALDANRITMADATRALNLRTEHFDKLRARLVRGASAGDADE